jgi:uncharacterized alkaline shock family protein YloU
MSENTKLDALEYGNVNISDDVIGTITSIAASEIEGVSSLSYGITDNIGEKFGIKSHSKGVRVDIAEENVSVDLNIIVEYGVRIPDICWKVQENVKKSIESMTGLVVSAVNVHVNGIDLKSKKSELPLDIE